MCSVRSTAAGGALCLLAAIASIRTAGQPVFTSYAHDGYSGGQVNAVIEATNGDLVIAGNGTEPGNSDQFAVRFSSTGSLVWGLTYTGGSGWSEYIADAVADPDGGVILLGHVRETATQRMHLSLFKFDAAGGVVWSHRYRAYDPDETVIGRSVRRDADGALHLLGSTGDPATRDLFIMKVDSAGGLLWTRALGYSGPDEARDLVLIPGGGYAIAAATKYELSRVALLDTMCAVIQDRVWVLPDTTLTIHSLQREADGRFSWTGVYMDSTFYRGAFHMVLDSLGGAVAAQAYRDAAGSELWMYDYVQLPDGDRFLVGEQVSASGDDEATPLIRLDATGGVVSSAYSGGHQELSRCIITTSDGGIACGETRRTDDNVHQAFQVKKLDANGVPACDLLPLTLIRTDHLPDTLSFPLEALGPKPMLRLDRPLTTWPLNNFVDGCSTIGIQDPQRGSGIRVFPNPACDRVMLTGITGTGTVRMYDMQGRMVLEQRPDASAAVDVRSLAGGCYALRIATAAGERASVVVIARP
ncbi:MAG TPA: T9SS type A sorting domain-containing protein [Flavobacteriales bacterium]|nr:T9SS type A sorting domain-containing protein [Flavobacteriales bacterium]HMR26657.1 T9SS type A sorting domain-containing protein [Flavobacteriales bacterium]